MLNKLFSFNILKRKPYFVECAKCKKIIEGWSKKDVLIEAQKKDWVFVEILV